MMLENEFVRDSNKRLSAIPLELRKRVQERALAGLRLIGAFDPLFDAEDEIFSDDFDEAADKEWRIRQQQISHGIEPDDEVVVSDEERQLIKHRHGKTDLHRAVEMGNVQEAMRLIKEGWNPLSVDNNGHDCIVIASLEENMEMLEMFRDEGLINEENDHGYSGYKSAVG